MQKPAYIIVHCSDSDHGSAREIRQWHQGRGWKDIGYHFVILNGQVTPDLYLAAMDGSIEAGRRLDGDPFIEPDEIGAHALGYNGKSIGVCLIGTTMFTSRQLGSLLMLLTGLCTIWRIPPANVLGHCETESGRKEGKTCPNFEVGQIRAELKGVLTW